MIAPSGSESVWLLLKTSENLCTCPVMHACWKIKREHESRTLTLGENSGACAFLIVSHLKGVYLGLGDNGICPVITTPRDSTYLARGNEYRWTRVVRAV